MDTSKNSGKGEDRKIRGAESISRVRELPGMERFENPLENETFIAFVPYPFYQYGSKIKMSELDRRSKCARL